MTSMRRERKKRCLTLHLPVSVCLLAMGPRGTGFITEGEEEEEEEEEEPSALNGLRNANQGTEVCVGRGRESDHVMADDRLPL